MGVGPAVVALLVALMQGVFCKTWDLTLPRTIVAISGSCVTIPCHFEVPNSEERNVLNCTNKGVWKKGSISGPSVFTARTIKGNVIGDLTKKNCTTAFHSFLEDHSDDYFYRLECTESLRFSFSNGVRITARSAPDAPTLTSERLVSEGALMKLQCTVPVPCSFLPPSITWFPRDNSWEELTQMQQSADEQMIMKSTLSFFASAEHHDQRVACSVSYPLTEGGSTEPSTATQRLKVQYGPRFTVATLSTSGPVSEGRTVTITCSSDANPPVSFYTWYRADNGQLTKRGEGQILVLKVDQGDSGAYLCEALSKRGSQRSGPVTLEVNATTGSSSSAAAVLYSTCAVMLVLYILTVVVSVCKYQSLSRRLKIEAKGENTYADLRICSVASDYDQLQPQQPKTMPPPDVPNYENLQKFQKPAAAEVDLKQ
ncbi:myelin-associated glycoprotein isoform X2 [Chelmon rostratus]|uniref:myelin-associated glycoprotein isoform X2 n=1 Tax=Chelmon rostratus TaxID=109905 RepID=UPI001BECDCE8|nr:myelin-associated glycoprotein isoform X2 [Chelmon rostratus]